MKIGIALALLPVALLVACGNGGTTSGTTNPQPATAATLTVQATAAPTSIAAPAATEQATSTPEASPPPEATAVPQATNAPTQPAAMPQNGAIAFDVVANGFTKPVYAADDGSGRMVVVEQPGRIQLVENGKPAATAFLDIMDRVGSSGNEQGLLSIAFHPKFAENGFFYVDYTNKKGDTVISRFTANGNTADPRSEKVLLQIDQPYANHNGGLVLFGPDGYLYIGMGDGGSGGDPQNRAQNLDELLGKLLRIDVDNGDPYAIPADNPFAQGGGRPEIWAYGLRNPWRYSFDRQTGDLFIGDVGQNKFEEINFQPAGKAGQNYGWNQVEGNDCYQNGCDPTAFVAPVATYPHEQGCSVTAGYLYRGRGSPTLQGTYFYGDYCSGIVWAMRPSDDGSWTTTVVLESDHRISSFAEDHTGELYMTDIGSGTLYQLVAAGS